MYHNTNNETGKTLKSSKKRTAIQEEIVLDYMRKVLRASPEQVWREAFKDSSIPLTSVRRAITNLTKQRKLKKLEAQVAGMYGKMISVWEII